MKKALVLFVALGLAAAPALAKKDCEELKREIEATLTTKQIKHFTLKIVNTGDEQGFKVVGGCEGGTRKIVYQRGGDGTPTAAEAPETGHKKARP
jgi:hypothetical protein